MSTIWKIESTELAKSFSMKLTQEELCEWRRVYTNWDSEITSPSSEKIVKDKESVSWCFIIVLFKLKFPVKVHN